MKTCTHCHAAQPLEAFYRHPRTTDGRGSWCKACTVQRARETAQSEAGRARLRVYWQRYRESHGLMADHPARSCRVCGTTFTTKSTQGRYCSQACRNKKDNTGRPGGFSDYHARMSSVWESKKAAAAHDRQVRRDKADDARLARSVERINLHFRQCVKCDAPFVAESLLQRYCTRDCRYGTAHAVHALACQLCGDAFETPYAGTRFCSPRCRRRGNPRRGSDKRLATRRPKVLAAYGWWCYLCQRDIDPAAPLLSDDGLTIDHVYPVVAGGTDNLQNLRPAHRKCNTDKGGRLPTTEEVARTRGLWCLDTPYTRSIGVVT